MPEPSSPDFSYIASDKATAPFYIEYFPVNIYCRAYLLLRITGVEFKPSTREAALIWPSAEGLMDNGDSRAGHFYD